MICLPLGRGYALYDQRVGFDPFVMILLTRNRGVVGKVEFMSSFAATSANPPCCPCKAKALPFWAAGFLRINTGLGMEQVCSFFESGGGL